MISMPLAPTEESFQAAHASFREVEIHQPNSSPDPTFHPKRTVAIALDASPYAAHALSWTAAHYLRPTTDRVILLHVRTQSLIPAIGLDGGTTLAYADAAEEAHIQDGTLLLQDYLAQLARYGVRHATGYSLPGVNRRQSIVEKAEEVRADVLVVGSRGMNSVSRALLGSVSDYCAHHATCPVLIVRPTIVELKEMEIPEAHRYPPLLTTPPGEALSKA